MGLVLKGFTRKRPIEMLREKTWIDELRERFPDCPNPLNYPQSAHFYLNERKVLQNRRKEK